MQLTVAYRGARTIAHLTERYADRQYLPIRDDMFTIGLEEDRVIELTYAEQPRPKKSRELDDIYPSTEELIDNIVQSGYRPLNVPEALALGNTATDMQFVCLGQTVPTDFGQQLLYVIRHGAGLLPLSRTWGASWVIPVTSTPDPLKA